jgi:hypothetical protein
MFRHFLCLVDTDINDTGWGGYRYKIVLHVLGHYKAQGCGRSRVCRALPGAAPAPVRPHPLQGPNSQERALGQVLLRLRPRQRVQGASRLPRALRRQPEGRPSGALDDRADERHVRGGTLRLPGRRATEAVSPSAGTRRALVDLPLDPCCGPQQRPRDVPVASGQGDLRSQRPRRHGGQQTDRSRTARQPRSGRPAVVGYRPSELVRLRRRQHRRRTFGPVGDDAQVEQRSTGWTSVVIPGGDEGDRLRSEALALKEVRAGASPRSGLAKNSADPARRFRKQLTSVEKRREQQTRAAQWEKSLDRAGP